MAAPNATQALKQCPACKAPNLVHMNQCQNCGHQFRTQFASTPPVDPVAVRMRRKAALAPWITVGKVFASVAVGMLLLSWWTEQVKEIQYKRTFISTYQDVYQQSGDQAASAYEDFTIRYPDHLNVVPSTYLAGLHDIGEEAASLERVSGQKFDDCILALLYAQRHGSPRNSLPENVQRYAAEYMRESRSR